MPCQQTEARSWGQSTTDRQRQREGLKYYLGWYHVVYPSWRCLPSHDTLSCSAVDLPSVSRWHAIATNNDRPPTHPQIEPSKWMMRNNEYSKRLLDYLNQFLFTHFSCGRNTFPAIQAAVKIATLPWYSRCNVCLTPFRSFKSVGKLVPSFHAPGFTHNGICPGQLHCAADH